MIRAKMRVNIDSKQFESALVIVLRTPGLYLLDRWWQLRPPDDREVSLPLTLLLPMFGAGCLLSTLNLEALVAVYMHTFAAILLVVSDIFSRYYVVSEIEALSLQYPKGQLRHFAAIAFHLIIAAFVCFLLDIRNDKKRLLLCSHCLPVLTRIAGVRGDTMLLLHNILSVVLLIAAGIYVITIVFPALMNWARKRWNETCSASEAEQDSIISGYSSLRFFDQLLPAQFLLLWIFLFISNLFVTCQTEAPSLLCLVSAAANSCCSPIGLVATGVMIGQTSKLLLIALKIFLVGDGSNYGDQDFFLQSGWTEGFTFTLLAFQGSLVDTEMPEKAGLMSIILFIVFSSLVQSAFEVTEPVVLALGASEVKFSRASLIKHGRAVVLCLALFIFPLCMTIMLSQVLDLDFWSLIVISTCLVTSVQVLGLLIVYCLFLYDMTKTEPWTKLDEVVYGARAMTRVLEFLIAVFVVCVGLKELFGEEWSMMNCSIVFVHCYFNVWQRLQAGWTSFLRRKDAVKKVKALPSVKLEDAKRMLRVTGGVSARLCRGHIFGNTLLWTSSRTFVVKTDQRLAQKTEFPAVWNTIYEGPLAKQLKLVKLFSLSTSGLGLAIQPVLMNQLMAYSSGVLKVLFAGFCGFFILATPLLLHMLAKRYVIRVKWDGDSKFVATTYSFMCREKTVEFTPDEVTIPEVCGPLTSFKVKNLAFFADPNYFTDLSGYEKMLGYDKPMDFKMGGKHQM
ncbi:unnamed protein product [Notodromas monacha]|uniref:TRC8-like N-terminal domain-containing protein n=1 Tax=Notodromas monacha TaxID=399045 RepID=A0A7R9BCB4_9CRUS|nr:unnamed protein product [Notodromas monacha]CAG0912672.1 unnamed protein product [Notodromas monacha]